MIWAILTILFLYAAMMIFIQGLAEAGRQKNKQEMGQGPRVFNMKNHRGWGNTIRWFDFDKLEIMGWMTSLPEEGDEVLCEMKSGQIGRWTIVKMNPESDPPDMFFAKVRFLSYYDKGDPRGN